MLLFKFIEEIMKIEKIIALLLALSFFALTSCSTAPTAEGGKAITEKNVKAPTLNTKKTLTEAEKKALEEADLWLPQTKK